MQGTIIADSYGAARGQHTFTILKEDGVKLLIKGRNLYRNGLFAKPRNAEERQKALSEKHARGMENFVRKEKQEGCQNGESLLLLKPKKSEKENKEMKKSK